MTIKPRRRPDITSHTIGRETILSSSTEPAIHILNPTAKHVWDLCDGSHTLQDIEASLRAHFAVPPDYPVIEDVRKIIHVLDEKGLLISQGRR